MQNIIALSSVMLLCPAALYSGWWSWPSLCYPCVWYKRKGEFLPCQCQLFWLVQQPLLSSAYALPGLLIDTDRLTHSLTEVGFVYCKYICVHVQCLLRKSWNSVTFVTFFARPSWITSHHIMQSFPMSTAEVSIYLSGFHWWALYILFACFSVLSCTMAYLVLHVHALTHSFPHVAMCLSLYGLMAGLNLCHDRKYSTSPWSDNGVLQVGRFDLLPLL